MSTGPPNRRRYLAIFGFCCCVNGLSFRCIIMVEFSIVWSVSFDAILQLITIPTESEVSRENITIIVLSYCTGS